MLTSGLHPLHLGKRATLVIFMHASLNEFVGVKYKKPYLCFLKGKSTEVIQHIQREEV